MTRRTAQLAQEAVSSSAVLASVAAVAGGSSASAPPAGSSSAVYVPVTPALQPAATLQVPPAGSMLLPPALPVALEQSLKLAMPFATLSVVGLRDLAGSAAVAEVLSPTLVNSVYVPTNTVVEAATARPLPVLPVGTKRTPEFALVPRAKRMRTDDGTSAATVASVNEELSVVVTAAPEQLSTPCADFTLSLVPAALWEGALPLERLQSVTAVCAARAKTSTSKVHRGADARLWTDVLHGFVCTWSHSTAQLPDTKLLALLRALAACRAGTTPPSTALRTLADVANMKAPPVLAPAPAGSSSISASGEWTITEDVMLLRCVAQYGTNWEFVREAMRSAMIPLPPVLCDPRWPVPQPASGNSTNMVQAGQRLGVSSALAAPARCRGIRTARQCSDRFRYLIMRSVIVTAVLPAGMVPNSSLAFARALTSTPELGADGRVPVSTTGPVNVFGAGYVSVATPNDQTVRIVVDTLIHTTTYRWLRHGMRVMGAFRSPAALEESGRSIAVVPACDFMAHSLLPARMSHVRNLMSMGNLLSRLKLARQHSYQATLIPDTVLALTEHHTYVDMLRADYERAALLKSSPPLASAPKPRAPSAIFPSIPLYPVASGVLPFADALPSEFAYAPAATTSAQTRVPALSWAYAPRVEPIRK
ncbi:MAG: hypothetical protein EOO41_01940, partial [Methanobacteriota archaeon]